MDKKHPSDKTKTEKINQRRFETTTKINLNDTYDDNEITLVDEIPEPDSVPEMSTEEEESVTTKIHLEVTEKKELESIPEEEPSNVSYKIKKIEQDMYAEKSMPINVDKLKVLAKTFLLYLLNLAAILIEKIAKMKFDRRTIKVLVISGLILVGLLVLIIGTGALINKFKAIGTKNKNNPQRTFVATASKIKGIKLSPLEFYTIKNEKLDTKKIKAGSAAILKFTVLDWHTSNDKKLNLDVDIRIYSSNGRLEVFQPKYLNFSSKTNKTEDKVLVTTKLNFSKDIPLGFYRVIISVTEKATQRQSNLQARLKLIP